MPTRCTENSTSSPRRGDRTATEVKSAAGANYTYDGDSLRIEKSNGTLYRRRYTGRVIEETNASATMHGDYILGAYPEHSRRKLVPESGNAFFASRMDLQDYYAYARYYDPRLGRFMSPDPLAGNVGNPQSLNRYTYVLNNPQTFIGPLGLDTSSTNCNSTAPCKVKVTATPVCYGPPTGADPFGGFWGWVPYYDKASCLLMQDQMKSGGDHLYAGMEGFVSPGVPASVYTRGLRRQAGPPSPQTHPPQDQNGWWPPAPREGTYGEWLACEANDVLSHPDKLEGIGFGYGAALIFGGSGQEKKVWASLAFTGLVEIGSALRTNMECEQEVNYHPSW